MHELFHTGAQPSEPLVLHCHTQLNTETDRLSGIFSPADWRPVGDPFGSGIPSVSYMSIAQTARNKQKTTDCSDSQQNPSSGEGLEGTRSLYRNALGVEQVSPQTCQKYETDIYKKGQDCSAQEVIFCLFRLFVSQTVECCTQDDGEVCASTGA